MRVPRGLQELNIQLSRLLEELTVQLGRSPSIPELAKAAEVGEEEGHAVIERIGAALRSGPHEILESLTISFGLAVCPRDGTDPESLFRAADESMYGAKRHPGGRLPFAS